MVDGEVIKENLEIHFKGGQHRFSKSVNYVLAQCNGKHVRYWYKDHVTKARKVETVDVFTFIGRMVEHIFPKGFQRVRYYGLQTTKTFAKWKEAIKKGLKRIGRIVKGAYQVGYFCPTPQKGKISHFEF